MFCPLPLTFIPSNHYCCIHCVLFAVQNMSDITSRFRIGAIVFVKANLILHAGDLGRQYGSKGSTMWIPGRVNHCDSKESKNGRTMRYVTCSFFLGGHQTKIKEVGIQATKIWPPEGCPYPENIIPLDVHAHLESNAPTITPTQLSQELHEALSTFPLPTAPPNPRRVSEQPNSARANLTLHGVSWEYNNDADNINCNGPSPYRAWGFRDSFGNTYAEESDTTCIDDHLDYFQLMMPPAAIRNILNLTNEQLNWIGKN